MLQIEYRDFTAGPVQDDLPKYGASSDPAPGAARYGFRLSVLYGHQHHVSERDMRCACNVSMAKCWL